jgi:hypothetical protein
MKKFNPEDYTEEELLRLATIGLKADIERCIRRFFKDAGLDIETTPYSPELARKLERYIKLNPGGIVSVDTIKITERKD